VDIAAEEQNVMRSTDDTLPQCIEIFAIIAKGDVTHGMEYALNVRARIRD
jgi:hypothetical protein